MIDVEGPRAETAKAIVALLDEARFIRDVARTSAAETRVYLAESIAYGFPASVRVQLRDPIATIHLTLHGAYLQIEGRTVLSDDLPDELTVWFEEIKRTSAVVEKINKLLAAAPALPLRPEW